MYWECMSHSEHDSMSYTSPDYYDILIWKFRSSLLLSCFDYLFIVKLNDIHDELVLPEKKKLRSPASSSSCLCFLVHVLPPADIKSEDYPALPGKEHSGYAMVSMRFNTKQFSQQSGLFGKQPQSFIPNWSAFFLTDDIWIIYTGELHKDFELTKHTSFCVFFIEGIFQSGNSNCTSLFITEILFSIVHKKVVK